MSFEAIAHPVSVGAIEFTDPAPPAPPPTTGRTYEIAGQAVPEYVAGRAPSDLCDRHPLFQQMPKVDEISDELFERRYGRDLDAIAAALDAIPAQAKKAAEAARDYLPEIRNRRAVEAVKPVVDAALTRARAMAERAAAEAEKTRALIPAVLESTRPKPADVGEHLAQELRAQELRALLRAQPMAERMRYVAKAVPAAPHVLRAALDAPDLEPLIPEEWRSKLLEDFAAATHPWLATRRDEHDFLERATRYTARMAEVVVERILRDNGIKLS